MKKLATIQSKEIFPGRPFLADEDCEEFRKSVRVIIFDADGKIALNHFPARGNFTGAYGLPGGGIGKGETLKEAVQRVAREESGCELKDIREMGMIVEYMY